MVIEAAPEARTYPGLTAWKMSGIPSRQKFYAMAAEGQIPGAIRAGSRWLFARQAFDRWLNGEQG